MYIDHFDVIVRKGKLLFNFKQAKYILRPLQYIFDIDLQDFYQTIKETVKDNVQISDDKVLRIYIYEEENQPIIRVNEILKSTNSEILKLIVHKQINPLKGDNCFHLFIHSKHYWEIYYSREGYDGFLCVNSRSRILKSNLGELIVFYNKVAYFLDIRNKFISANPVIPALAKYMQRKGMIKKYIGKSNGFSVNLIEKAQEVYLINTSVYRVELIDMGNRRFTYNKNNFEALIKKYIENYG